MYVPAVHVKPPAGTATLHASCTAPVTVSPATLVVNEAEPIQAEGLTGDQAAALINEPGYDADNESDSDNDVVERDVDDFLAINEGEIVAADPDEDNSDDEIIE